MQKRIRAKFVVTALILVAASELTAQQFGGSFGDAVEFAQKRSVKLYGASIGRVSGFATGILVSDDGKIITSQGVHLSTDQIRVTTHDGKLHFAKVLRRSRTLQLALLQVVPNEAGESISTPNFFELTETPSVRKGDWILAVSNAFKVADGSEPLSVNLGVVSLRTRLDVRRGVQDFSYDGDVLLIDAITSNPGAAGGAVVTVDKKLAGMIGKVLESKSTNTRLNYAVPADLIAQFVAGKIQDTPLNTLAQGKAVLGIRLFRLGGRKSPAYVDRVLSGGPAAKAKLRPDDLIVSIAGQPVKNSLEYQKVVDTLTPGKEVTMVLKRRNQVMTVQITPDAEK